MDPTDEDREKDFECGRDRHKGTSTGQLRNEGNFLNRLRGLMYCEAGGESFINIGCLKQLPHLGLNAFCKAAQVDCQDLLSFKAWPGREVGCFDLK